MRDGWAWLAGGRDTSRTGGTAVSRPLVQTRPGVRRYVTNLWRRTLAGLAGYRNGREVVAKPSAARRPALRLVVGRELWPGRAMKASRSRVSRLRVARCNRFASAGDPSPSWVGHRSGTVVVVVASLGRGMRTTRADALGPAWALCFCVSDGVPVVAMGAGRETSNMATVPQPAPQPDSSVLDRGSTYDGIESVAKLRSQPGSGGCGCPGP
jgi:hypothetical protein